MNLPPQIGLLNDKIKEEILSWGKVLHVHTEGLPPSVNKSVRTAFKRGRITKFKSSEYVNYCLQMRLMNRHLKAHKVIGPLALVVSFHSPKWVTKAGCTRTHMDLDNRLKTMLDAIHGSGKDTGVLMCDDSYYWIIVAEKVQSELREFTSAVIVDMGHKGDKK